MVRQIDSKRLSICFLLALSLNAGAQTSVKDSTLNRTVVVEQEYNPDILDASKINILPKVEEPVVAKKKIEYSIVPVPAVSFGDYQTMTAFSHPEKQSKAKPGYVRLGYGNYGNLDARLSYLFRLSERDRLGVTAAMNGMNGKLNFPDLGKYKQHYYRSSAAIDYLHRFAKLDMDIAGRWGLSNLSNHPLTPLTHQRFTSGDVHWGVKSTDETLPVRFDVETNFLLYTRAHNWTGVASEENKAKENRVYTKANVSGAVNDKQRVGIFLGMNNLFYKESYQRDYTSLQLNPYYELNTDNWKLRAGANVDFSFGFGKALQVSPDIDVQYIFSDSYILYVQAKGGRMLNDFRHMEAFCPYAVLFKGQKVKNTYEQLNTSLGLKASPYPGIHFHIYGGYQRLEDDLYQTYDNAADYIGFGQTNGSNVYAGASFSYAYKDVFDMSVEGIYKHWDMEDEALAFKPSCLLNAEVNVHPIKTLNLNMGYKYLKHQKDFRQGNVNNLSVSASYAIYKDLSVYVKADNLLNKKYSFYWHYPVEGFNFIAGFSYRF